MARVEYISHDEAFQKSWKDPEYRRAYRLIKPRYDIVREIIRLRLKKGLTQKEIATLAGTHQSRVSKIEAAEYDVRLSTLVKLANALDADVKIELVPRVASDIHSQLNRYIISRSSFVVSAPVLTPEKTEVKEKVFAEYGR